jgi:hypothetical protein
MLGLGRTSGIAMNALTALIETDWHSFREQFKKSVGPSERPSEHAKLTPPPTNLQGRARAEVADST